MDLTIVTHMLSALPRETLHQLHASFSDILEAIEHELGISNEIIGAQPPAPTALTTVRVRGWLDLICGRTGTIGRPAGPGCSHVRFSDGEEAVLPNEALQYLTLAPTAPTSAETSSSPTPLPVATSPLPQGSDLNAAHVADAVATEPLAYEPEPWTPLHQRGPATE